MTPILGAALAEVSATANVVFTLTNHRFGSIVFLMNSERFNSLSTQHRTLLLAAFEKSRAAYGEGRVDKEYERLTNLTVAKAEISTYKAAVLKSEVMKELRKTEPGNLIQRVAGDPNCPSSNQCKCKTSVYGTKMHL